MLRKQYIAIILVMVFSGKLITVDADIFSFVNGNSMVLLLNPICEKNKNSFKETGESFKFSSPLKILKLARTCFNNYQIIPENEFAEVLHSEYKRFSYTTHLFDVIHLRKLYPPPKNLIET